MSSTIWIHLKYYLTSRTHGLARSLILIAISLVLAVLTLVAGETPHVLRGCAILTFDTSSVPGNILNYLRQQNVTATTAGNIQDWYDVHYLSICKGQWNLHQAANGKNLSTIVCQRQPLGYNFSLSETLAADAVPAAFPLFQNWDYGSIDTQPPVAILIVAIILFVVSVLASLSGLYQNQQLEARRPLSILRVGFMSSVFNVTLMTNSAAQITARAQKVVGSVSSPVTVNAWKSQQFYGLTWTTVALTWIVVILLIILAFQIKHSLSKGETLDEETSPERAAEDEQRVTQ